MKLILLRHGQSLWNLENKFTGRTDVDLSDQGIKEAHRAGKLLKSEVYSIDAAYTSLLKRAIRAFGSSWMRWILCGFQHIVPGGLMNGIMDRWRNLINKTRPINMDMNRFRFGDAVMILYHLPWLKQIADIQVATDVILTCKKKNYPALNA